MNIATQLCGLAIMLITFVFYHKQTKLNNFSTKAFMAIYSATFVSVILDILSVYMISNSDKFSDYTIIFVCRMYLCFLILLSVCMFMYILFDASKRKTYKKVAWYMLAVFIAGVSSVSLAPLKYTNVNGISYSYGAGVYCTFGFCLFFVLSGLLMAFIMKKKMNPIRRNTYLCWSYMLIIMSVFQILNREYLVIGFGCCIGVLLLYIRTENPELYIDRTTGFFNQNAFYDFISEKYRLKRNFSLILMQYGSDSLKYLSSDAGSDVLWNAIEYLNRIRGVKLFRISEEEVVMMCDDENEASKYADILRSRLDNTWDEDEKIYINGYVVLIKNCLKLHDKSDLFYLMRYVNLRNMDDSQTLVKNVSDDMIENMYREKETEVLINDAIKNDKICVYYQPIYSSEKNIYASAEALVRIKDDNGELIYPGDFISIAEKTGQILQLGKIVFDKVCRFIRDNSLEEYGVNYIEVNLSMVQCADKNLADTYIGIMKKYDINPTQINLEITESASASAKETLLENMKKLIEFGVHFSLDDFGTGQSNLNYIVDMPVNIVKFDKDMINAYFKNGKAKYVMDAAMHMIQGMNLEIVAEGIEEKEQYEYMKNMGISYIQGFYFSEPVTEDGFINKIKEQKW